MHFDTSLHSCLWVGVGEGCLFDRLRFLKISGLGYARVHMGRYKHSPWEIHTQNVPGGSLGEGGEVFKSVFSAFGSEAEKKVIIFVFVVVWWVFAFFFLFDQVFSLPQEGRRVPL